MGIIGRIADCKQLKRYMATANMYADISFKDMQDGLNGLYEK
jgi:hypothetical protein